jgi:glyoxylase-like metal-dependent hydrolase (beta-lactamase superfamily II)
MKKNKSEKLFHVEIMRGIFLISSLHTSPTTEEKSLAPGNPTGNSYLVVGKKRALLFDLAVNEIGMREYCERLAGKPLQLVLSHGHPDHAYHLNEFGDVWMHPADEKLIREGMLGIPPANPCPNIYFLQDRDTIDLGDRVLDVFNIPGHTQGSILLLDHSTKVLLSGDTCTRHLLYGIKYFIPLNVFCDSLRRLQAQAFDVIYSAHDRCALSKAFLEHMIQLIAHDLPHTKKTWSFPGLGKMAMLVHGDLYTLDYFDVSIPKKHLKSLTVPDKTVSDL